MACENCENGCVNPNLCDESCTTANPCDIPAGSPGATGPSGPPGLPGQPGADGQDGQDGLNGCTITNVYLSDGSTPVDTPAGHLIVETGNTGEPCEQVFDAGNITASISGGGGNDGIPSGVIVMWSGSIANIPSGWALCDGSNGTPDLQGRFVVGRDPTIGSPFTSIGNIGGSQSASLTQTNIPAHTHSLAAITISVDYGGGHYHTWRGFGNENGNGSGYQDRSRSWIAGDPLEPCTIQPIAATDFFDPDYGAHQHTASFSPNVTADGTPALSAGVGTPFATLPPYYTLAFIIKL